MQKNKNRYWYIAVATFSVILILILVESLIMIYNNRNKAKSTAELYLSSLSNMIAANEVSEPGPADLSVLLQMMPEYDGLYVIIADSKTGRVEASTDKLYDGKSLSELGIATEETTAQKMSYENVKISGNTFYCAAEVFKNYSLIVLQDRTTVNADIIPIQAFMLAYLVATAVVIILVIKNFTKQIVKEMEKANRDHMTGLLNRFAYENYLDENPGVPADCNFVYAALDLNGLKNANDTLGHDAGDEMIKSTAECMKKAFGNFGKMYRTGGDEFIAILSLPEDELERVKNEFDEAVNNWTGRRFVHMTVSAGYVMSAEFPERSIRELAKIADDRMYLAKEEYYKTKGIDRRTAHVYATDVNEIKNK